MQLTIHQYQSISAAELVSGSCVLEEVSDMMDVMANASIQGAEISIIHKNDIPETFFDLKSGFAGEILQKYSNYRKKLAIIGDFSKVSSKSLKDFISESNKTGQILFTKNLQSALDFFGSEK